MKHDVLPRILAFDQVTLRRMTTMALDIGKHPPSYASCPVRVLAQCCSICSHSSAASNQQHIVHVTAQECQQRLLHMSKFCRRRPTTSSHAATHVADKSRAAWPRIFSTTRRWCKCSCPTAGIYPTPDGHSRAEWLLPVSDSTVPSSSKKHISHSHPFMCRPAN
jgi:hypothetical protein